MRAEDTLYVYHRDHCRRCGTEIRTVELAGPQRFRLDKLAERVLRANGDAREVTADVHARYFGAELFEHSLTPGDNPRIAPTHFEDWLSRSVTQGRAS